MKVAVIGSRTLGVNNLKAYLPDNTTTIISGGAAGIDSVAKEFAFRNNIPIIEFLPEYNKYGRSAPIKRNVLIIENADTVIAFWDGKSRGTKFVIDYCLRHNKEILVYMHTHGGNYTLHSI